jgi:hypothetical protein
MKTAALEIILTIRASILFSTPNSVKIVIVCPTRTPASSAALPSDASPSFVLFHRQ